MNKKTLLQYLLHGTGPFTCSGTQALASTVSSYAKAAGEPDWPDIQLILQGASVFTRIHEYFNSGFCVKKEVLRKYYDKTTIYKDSFHIYIRYV